MVMETILSFYHFLWPGDVTSSFSKDNSANFLDKKEVQ